MTLAPMIQGLIDKFNDRVDTDEKLRNELDGIDKKVLMDLDSEKYNFHLQNMKIEKLFDGAIDDPDITLISDPETMRGVLDGSIKPMKAFALRKIKVKGNIDDLLRMRKLF